MPASSRPERVKPCLLDRIVEDDFAAPGEQRAFRAVSPQRYVKAVFRDLRWLFNAGAPPAATLLSAGQSWNGAGKSRPRFDDETEEDQAGWRLADFPEAYNS